jgi:squalene synthase HpnC
VLGRARSENFRVASRALSPTARRHILAFYGFARLVDEIGDSYRGDRPAALDRIEAETRRALAGADGSMISATASQISTANTPAGEAVHPLVRRAARSVVDLGLDPEPLFRLIAANRVDQILARYDTFEQLLGYCALSANPVGELVLGAFGAHTPERVRRSDAICSGLQLVEHWQDIAEDAAAGRVYLPAEDLIRFGVDPSELLGVAPARPELRALVAFEASRARRLLREGLPLVGGLSGRPRWAIAGFWAGGMAALDAIEAQRFDPLLGSPRPRPGRVALRLAQALSTPANAPTPEPEPAARGGEGQ